MVYGAIFDEDNSSDFIFLHPPNKGQKIPRLGECLPVSSPINFTVNDLDAV